MGRRKREIQLIIVQIQWILLLINPD